LFIEGFIKRVVRKKEHYMARIIEEASIIKAAGTKPKRIEEYFGRVNTETEAVSIARMISPQGWVEPGQKPEFDEYTVVLNGTLRVETEAETLNVRSGQAVFVQKNEWVRYSTPTEGAEYIAVCIPGFSPDTVHRDDT